MREGLVKTQLPKQNSSLACRIKRGHCLSVCFNVLISISFAFVFALYFFTNSNDLSLYLFQIFCNKLRPFESVSCFTPLLQLCVIQLFTWILHLCWLSHSWERLNVYCWVNDFPSQCPTTGVSKAVVCATMSM